MMEVDRAWTACQMRPGQRLIDYGAGPARATAEFAARGLAVLAVDIADNARETTVPFLEACLWDLPSDLCPVEYGYCCDVMEHIPLERVAAVLDGIARRTLAAAYFRIATRPDVMGKRLIGEPLHLTIRDGAWWRDRVAEHFASVEVLRDTGRDVMIVARLDAA